ncbi:MAG TPA: TlpA disulfide reductase family protein [Burkholderiaceae bacterium]|jgi:thiol-disulfide isomerase/thioredoxin|nr:TlpA disulfide reductase family protein [Burkholderiaceae bacterium]
MLIDPPNRLSDPAPAAAVALVESGGSHRTRRRAGLGRPVLLMGAALSVAALGMAAWLFLEDPQPEPRAAPRLDIPLVRGDSLNLSALHGKVVLVSFWGESCPACERQMPVVSLLQQRWQAQGLVVVVVAPAHVSARQVLDYSTRHALPSVSGLDPSGEIARQLGPIQSLPAHVLIDRRGMIVQRLEGDVPAARLEGRVAEALAGGVGG